MKNQIITSLKMLIVMTVITGGIYPLLVTGIAQIAFHHEANGSIIIVNDSLVGSELIGQKFDLPGYFHSRPSAIDYYPMPSGGSNLGPSSAKLAQQIPERKHLFARDNMLRDTTDIPVEMLTASASGLDPDISPEAALMQVARVAGERGFDKAKEQKLLQLIAKHTARPQFLLFGEPRINVLLLNLELDKL